jgi:PilZ domain.
MKDNRRFRRRSLLFELKVTEKNSGEALGRVANLTPDGLMLVNADRIVDNSLVTLRIELPEKIFGKDTIDCDAKCMWCRPVVNTKLFEAGFQLLEMGEMDVQTIVALITKYRILD